MFAIFILASILHICSSSSLSEDIYYEEPFYVETRPTRCKYQGNFPQKRADVFSEVNSYYKHGRDRGKILDTSVENDFDPDYDLDGEFARPTRSQEKNDNFVRFGRGSSDFVRFGRTPYSNGNFLRFGRSLNGVELEEKRSKREVVDTYERPDGDHTKENDKRAERDNFLRFGRAGDDGFVRYGRNQKMAGGDESPDPSATKSRPTLVSSSYYPRQSIDLLDKIDNIAPLLSLLHKLREVGQIKRKDCCN